MPCGNALNSSSENLRKQLTDVKKAYDNAYAERKRAAAADRAAVAAMGGHPGLPPPTLSVSIATPQRTQDAAEPDAIDVLLGRMGDSVNLGKQQNDS